MSSVIFSLVTRPDQDMWTSWLFLSLRNRNIYNYKAKKKSQKKIKVWTLMTFVQSSTESCSYLVIARMAMLGLTSLTVTTGSRA